MRAVVIWLLTMSVAAAAPTRLAHQGRLLDAAGGAITGPTTLVVTLHTDAVADAAVFTETHIGVPVADGYYAIELGAVNPLSDTLFVTHPDLWLEVSVGPTPLGPRSRLVSVPWAIRAATSANVDLGGGALFDGAGNLSVPGSVRVGANAASCAAGLEGAIRWHDDALWVCTGTAWATVYTAKDGSTAARASESCLRLHADVPTAGSGAYWVDPDGEGANGAFRVYCDMTPGDAGWTLVAIANSATQPPVDLNADPSNPGVGDYVKPLIGGSGTQSRFECGATATGTIGYQVNTGSWSWSGTHISASLPTLEADNVVWPADVPGYDSPNAADPWGNHIGGVHYPNFGHTGFHNVDGRTFRQGVFTCNPQSGAYGNGDTAWTGYSGTRFVRYWLR